MGSVCFDYYNIQESVSSRGIRARIKHTLLSVKKPKALEKRSESPDPCCCAWRMASSLSTVTQPVSQCERMRSGISEMDVTNFVDLHYERSARSGGESYIPGLQSWKRRLR